jgi:hypothetical protein
LYLDKVSTTCGSGWVDDGMQYSYGFKFEGLTHPLPQVVLTLSNRDV